MKTQLSEIVMGSAMSEGLENVLRWVRKHPLTATTAAVMLVAALAVPIARQSLSSAQIAPPPADLGPDETPLFV